jgi:hypothetical protein
MYPEAVNYSIDFDVRSDYLYAYVEGDVRSAEARVASWKTMITRTRSEGKRKLLAVRDSPGTNSIMEGSLAGFQLIEWGVADLKIAFVDLNPDNRESNEFCELIAANRATAYRIFENEPAALRWLLQ